MQQRQSWHILTIVLALMAAALSCGFTNRPTATPGLASAPADPAWCDQDGDGFCPKPIWSDCNDNDPLIHPGAEEQADFIDSNCNGFGDEPPIGFARQDYSMQGAGSAVEWYGDYVYLAAASVLQIYYAPPSAEPTRLENEIEFRDWVREMAVDGDTLFVAARGDGLYAFDLGQDPAHPTAAGHISSRFDASGYADIEAVFNGVHARGGRVAAARANSVAKSQGGVDAIVFDYDTTSDSFTPVRVIGTEVRSKTVPEIPISVALTEDGSGLYIGYGVLVGELVYLTVDSPAAPVLHAGDLATCPNQPFLLSPQEPLGSFGSDLIPRRLVVDSARNRLMVGATAKPTFPVKEGGLWLYDLNSFDPSSVADMDNHRTDITPDESIRVTYSSVYDVLLFSKQP